MQTRGLLVTLLVVACLLQAGHLLHKSFRVPHYKPRASIRDLTWGDINFIHTTDTHGWYSGHLNQKIYKGNWGDFVSFTTKLRALAHENNQDLLLIDSGDRHDGNGFSDVTTPNGLYSTPVFLKQNYDLLTIGNHELYVWENSLQEYDLVVNHFPDKYVSSNVEIRINDTFVPFGNKFKFFSTPVTNTSILSFGFLFDFQRNNDKTKVTPLKEVINQSWFKQTLQKYAEETDLIVIVTHVPITHDWPELWELHQVLRKTYRNTPIQYFGGHSHIRDFVVFDDNATGIQSGRFCETVGWTSVNFRGESLREKFSRSYIDFNTDSFAHHVNCSDVKCFETSKGKEISKLITDIRDKLGLDDPIGQVTRNNYYVDYVPLDNQKNIYHFLTHEVLHILEYPQDSKDERIIIINTGSVRYDLYKGPYTIDSQYIVSPFENDWTSISLPKKVALKIAAVLNNDGYIASSADSIDNSKLLPPHHRYNSHSRLSKRRQQVLELSDDLEIERKAKLTKGYVTIDDFGNDGDDTVHKPVIQFPVSNVVESVQLSNDNETTVDVVFYEFIRPNILWALKQLEYKEEVEPKFYSRKYLGLLLNDYVRDHKV